MREPLVIAGKSDTLIVPSHEGEIMKGKDVYFAGSLEV
jgi:hypothetical protein